MVEVYIKVYFGNVKAYGSLTEQSPNSLLYDVFAEKSE
jgi:hypothetical protein